MARAAAGIVVGRLAGGVGGGGDVAVSLAGGGGRDVNLHRIVSSLHFISLRFSEMK